MKKSILILLLLSGLAQADSESHTAGSYENGTNWTNPSYSTGTGDNSCAQYNNTSSDILTLYNFTFTNVTGTVDSINAVVDGYGIESIAGRRHIQVRLTKNGGSGGAGVGTNYPNIALVQGGNCAGSGNVSILGKILWGTTWTAAEITASSFGINVSDDDLNAHILGIDAVTITVWYTPVPPAAYKGQVITIGGD